MTKKRYWLMGGIIMLGIYVVITAVLYPFGGPTRCDFICFPYWSLPTIIPAGLIINFFDSLGIHLIPNNLYDVVVFVLLSSVSYFLVGLIIGLIYGKYKNKNI